MNRLKGPALVLVFAAVFAFALAPAASAQTLDGKWYKVNGQITGKAVDRVTGNIADYMSSFIMYVHFDYLGIGTGPRGSVYRVQVWSKTGPDRWNITLMSDMATSAYNEHFFPEMLIGTVTKSLTVIVMEGTTMVSVSPNLFRGTGLIKGNKDPLGRIIYGMTTFTGSWVTSLPFQPVE